MVEGHHILFRSVTEVFGGVGDEEVAEVDISAFVGLPFCHAADIDTAILIVEWLTEEAQVSWSQKAIDLVVSCHEGQALAILKQVAPDLAVTMEGVEDGGITEIALADGWLTIPELSCD